ncbi:DUF3168 domain-containing protein [Rhizobium sp. LCM 4573]|uniref:DUF3168 domain-containing protein n=1 Tax=Rhizobium sp. LCM 4573 TaxID=1848291 RepID=UPI0008D9E3B0|nr:DUF3168 domain-containing protein [Rhizobium sp. LCM 4573]OHV75645.1 hypothetical protein LCM4573_16030 [Rhizobium sp. LCM 4573]
MTAANALLAAIHARLSGDGALMGMIGRDGIRDRWLARTHMPSIVFGEMETRDYSSSTEDAEEHLLTLEIWSGAEGRREVVEIAGRTCALLDDAALALDGAVLVNLRYRDMRIWREAKSKLFCAEVRFRALTEPAS